MFFEDEAELPVSSGLSRGSCFGFAGEVLAEIALGTRQVSIGFEQGDGCEIERRSIIRNAALSLGECGIKLAPVLLMGERDGEIGITSNAIWIGGNADAGEVLCLSVAAVAVAGEDGSEIDNGAIEVRIELHGAAQVRLNFRQRTFLHLEKRGFGESSVGGIDLVNLLESFAGLGLGAADDCGRLLVEPHGFLETADVAGIELDCEIGFATHLAGEGNSTTEDSELESFVAEDVGVLAMELAAIGRSFSGAAGKIDGAVEVSIGIVDGGHPGERFGIIGVALDSLLGDAMELAEMSLFEQGFTIGAKGQGGSKKDKKKSRAESEGRRHQTSKDVSRGPG